MKKPQVPVAREGYPFIAFAAFVSLVTAVLGHQTISLVGVLATGFALYFFRDPERISPDDKDVIVSPADGKVLLVEKVFDDRFLREHVYKVSIFMNAFDVHVNRIPFPGVVAKISYVAGAFLAANLERASLENEHCALVLTTAGERRLAVVQIAGVMARRIVCWAVKGDQVERGERFGLIRFGSRVDLYLPLQAQLEILPGQKVRAGETVLGYLA